MNDHSQKSIDLLDHRPSAGVFLEEVLEGLLRPQKTLPCKYFYDDRGSRLFDRICELEEYYPTRTELAIMRAHVGEMAAEIGDRALIIEYGSGSGLKIRLLLDHLREPAAYIPVDISRAHLMRAASGLVRDHPDLAVCPVCADFTGPFDLPACGEPPARRVGYFPGSTIGNFTHEEARAFLGRVAETCGPGGGLLIGVDLKKDVQTLEAAYNDGEGVTEAFNLNILSNINRALGADFRLERFRHRAFYNEAQGRIEMHLVCAETHTVRVGSEEIRFEKGETIHTENSHKYGPDEFQELARAGGFRVRRVWTDPKRLFSVQYLAVAEG